MRVAPALWQTFKALTASDLYERYHGEGGQHRLELDLCVASEISDQVKERIDSTQGKTDAGGAVARRNQRRQARGEALSDADAVKLLKDGGFMG